MSKIYDGMGQDVTANYVSKTEYDGLNCCHDKTLIENAKLKAKLKKAEDEIKRLRG